MKFFDLVIDISDNSNLNSAISDQDLFELIYGYLTSSSELFCSDKPGSLRLVSGHRNNFNVVFCGTKVEREVNTLPELKQRIYEML